MADLVEVFVTPSVPEAEVVRSRLQDEGIPVLATGTDSPYRMGPVRLFVPVDLEVQAKIVLASVIDGPFEDDAEPSGEPLGPSEDG
jgi:hypothetical protein